MSFDTKHRCTPNLYYFNLDCPGSLHVLWARMQYIKTGFLFQFLNFISWRNIQQCFHISEKFLFNHIRSIYFLCGCRRKKASNGRPEKRDPKVRRTMVMWVKWRMTTTWSSAECAKMVENYCAAIHAPRHTTSTAWTHHSLKFPMESGSALVAR